MISPHTAMLGQAEEPAYSIDQIFAREIAGAIELLVASEIPEGWAGEQCWIDLRIRRWEAIATFYRRLTDFLGGTAQALQITAEEEPLIGEVMVCIESLLQKESAETTATVESTATVIGILGGLIALSVAVGLV